MKRMLRENRSGGWESWVVHNEKRWIIHRNASKSLINDRMWVEKGSDSFDLISNIGMMKNLHRRNWQLESIDELALQSALRIETFAFYIPHWLTNNFIWNPNEVCDSVRFDWSFVATSHDVNESRRRRLNRTWMERTTAKKKAGWMTD